MSYALSTTLKLDGFDRINTRPNVVSTIMLVPKEDAVPCKVPTSCWVSGSQMRPPDEYKSPLANFNPFAKPCNRLLVVEVAFTPDAVTENLTNSKPLEKLS